MNNNQNNLTHLPLNAMRSIPTPNPDALQIVALAKSGGKVTGYKLSDGRVVAKSEGVALARQGGIQGVGIAVNQGNEYLKSIPDGNSNNNLGNLPSITQ